MKRTGRERDARRNTQRAALYFLRQSGLTRAAAREELYGAGRATVHPTRRTVLARAVGVNAAVRREKRRRAAAAASAASVAESAF
jgi:tRNA(His) 5'-end guanylyltransferase